MAFKIKSFYCRDYDDSEIDDDDTLAEILKMPPKHPATVHLFVALKPNEEIPKRDGIQTLSTCSNSGSIQTLDSMKKELTDLRADLEDKSEDTDKRFSKLKHEEEKLKKKMQMKCRFLFLSFSLDFKFGYHFIRKQLRAIKKCGNFNFCYF